MNEDSKLEEGIAALAEMFPSLSLDTLCNQLLVTSCDITAAAIQLSQHQQNNEKLVSATSPSVSLPPSVPQPIPSDTQAIQQRFEENPTKLLSEILGSSVSNKEIESALLSSNGDLNLAAQQLLNSIFSPPSCRSESTSASTLTSSNSTEKYQVQNIESFGNEEWMIEAIKRAEMFERIEREDQEFSRRINFQNEEEKNDDDEQLARAISQVEEEEERKLKQTKEDERIARQITENEQRIEKDAEYARRLSQMEEEQKTGDRNRIHLKEINEEEILQTAMRDFERSSLSYCGYKRISCGKLEHRFVDEFLNRKAGQRLLAVTYHGTNSDNFESISRIGLVVPGSGDGKHVKIVHGKALGIGIYMATEPSIAMRYASGDHNGPNMIVSLVLLGGRFVTSHEGSVLVVTNPDQVLPLFGFEMDINSDPEVSFTRTPIRITAKTKEVMEDLKAEIVRLQGRCNELELKLLISQQNYKTSSSTTQEESAQQKKVVEAQQQHQQGICLRCKELEEEVKRLKDDIEIRANTVISLEDSEAAERKHAMISEMLETQLSASKIREERLIQENESLRKAISTIPTTNELTNIQQQQHQQLQQQSSNSAGGGEEVRALRQEYHRLFQEYEFLKEREKNAMEIKRQAVQKVENEKAAIKSQLVSSVQRRNELMVELASVSQLMQKEKKENETRKEHEIELQRSLDETTKRRIELENAIKTVVNFLGLEEVNEIIKDITENSIVEKIREMKIEAEKLKKAIDETKEREKELVNKTVNLEQQLVNVGKELETKKKELEERLNELKNSHKQIEEASEKINRLETIAQAQNGVIETLSEAKGQAEKTLSVSFFSL